MKKFITRIVWYTLSVVLLLVLITEIVDLGLKKTNNDMFGDWNRLFNNEINDDIIIVGNSRAKVHFNPLIIEEITGYSCYNLGKDATNLFLQQPIINAVFANSKPKYLVISLDIGSFQEKQEIFEKEQYLPYLDKPYIYFSLSEVDPNIDIERTTQIVKYRGQSKIIATGLESYLNPVDFYTLNKGFYGRHKKWNSDFDNFKTLMGDSKIILSQREIEEGLSLLEDIIMNCKENDVELILCQTPKLKALYKYFPQKVQVDKRIEKIARKNNILYLDFSYDSLHLDKKNFYNASHLNVVGANKLSHKFSELFNENFDKK